MDFHLQYWPCDILYQNSKMEKCRRYFPPSSPIKWYQLPRTRILLETLVFCNCWSRWEENDNGLLHLIHGKRGNWSKQVQGFQSMHALLIWNAQWIVGGSFCFISKGLQASWFSDHHHTKGIQHLSKTCQFKSNSALLHSLSQTVVYRLMDKLTWKSSP